MKLTKEVEKDYKKAKIRLLDENDFLFTDETFDTKNINLIHDVKAEIKRIHFIKCTFNVFPKEFVKDMILYDCSSVRLLQPVYVYNINIYLVSSKNSAFEGTFSF